MSYILSMLALVDHELFPVYPSLPSVPQILVLFIGTFFFFFSFPMNLGLPDAFSTLILCYEGSYPLVCVFPKDKMKEVRVNITCYHKMFLFPA